MDSSWNEPLPEVSFIVPSCAGRSTIEPTLQSIQGQSSSLSREIVVVDSSAAGLPESLEKLYPGLRLFHESTRRWPGAARNLGAERARGRWIAFVDADAVLEENWLERLHSTLLTNPRGVVGGRVVNANPEEDEGSVLHWLEFSEFLPGGKGGPRPFISSSNLLIERTRFLKSGGFDERLRMSEDSAFCHRYTGPVLFCGATGVRHPHRTGADQVHEHLRKHGHWSGVYRALYPAPGSFLVNWPALSRLLPLWRLPLVVWRVCSSSPAQTGKCVRLLPSLLRGLAAWSRGFREGLESRAADAQANRPSTL